MALRTTDGTLVDKATFTGTVATSDPINRYKVSETLYEDYQIPGTNRVGRRVKFYEGEEIDQTQMDAAFADATITSLDPNTGPAAGGTAVTITGTNLLDASAVTFGGAAATALDAVNDTTVTCTTPAGTAGAQDVVVTTPSGDVTSTGGFTYV